MISILYEKKNLKFFRISLCLFHIKNYISDIPCLTFYFTRMNEYALFIRIEYSSQPYSIQLHMYRE